MRVTKIYYERLISTGDFSNVRFGAEGVVGDVDSFEGARNCLVELVDFEIQRLASRKYVTDCTKWKSDELNQLEDAIDVREKRLNAMRDWIRDNQPLITLWESASGQRAATVSEIPF